KLLNLSILYVSLCLGFTIKVSSNNKGDNYDCYYCILSNLFHCLSFSCLSLYPLASPTLSVFLPKFIKSLTPSKSSMSANLLILFFFQYQHALTILSASVNNKSGLFT